jgi:hypothetical protein
VGGWSHPLGQNRIVQPPHFWLRGGMAKGVVRSHAKKKKRKNGFWAFGGGRITPKGLEATPYNLHGGWPKPPQALGGGPATPKTQNLFFFFLSFWPPLWPWGWFDHPQPGHPFGHGGGLTTPRPAGGLAPAIPWLKIGWSDHSILA